MKKAKALVKVMPPQGKADKAALLPAMAERWRDIVEMVGEDTTRDGLLRTPERAAKAMQFLTSGYEADIPQLVNGALFDVEYDDMVVVKDIEFFSLCEHHLLPFYGKMHVAYIPQGKVIGLSKIPRIVDALARRLQVQERLTQQVAETIRELLSPLGVGVVAEARHFCMMMRGVEKQHSSTATSAMLGSFRDRKDTRDEFLSLLRTRSMEF